MAYAALVVDLTAKLTNLQQGMDRAVKIAQDSSKKIESAFSFGGAAKAGAGFFAAQVGLESIRDTLNKVKDLSDEWTRTRVLIENVTKSIGEAERAQRGLYEAAQATRQNFGELSRSYASFARNSEQLGITSDQAVKLQTTVAQAIALSGARADSAASALVQFGQGIASGVLRGEELNSVLEQTPKLAKALADGMGVPIGELIKMGKEGELTADKIIVALQKVAPQIQREFDKVTPTIADSFTSLNNALGNVINRFNEVIPVASALSNIILGIASALDKIVEFSRFDPNVAAKNAAALNELQAQRAREAIAAIESNDQIPPATRQRLLDAARARLDAANRAAVANANRLAEQGQLPDGSPRPNFAELDKQMEARFARQKTQAAEAAGAVVAEMNGISKAFEKNAAAIRAAFEAGVYGDPNDPKTKATYEGLITQLMKKSGFFPTPKKKDSTDPLQGIIRDAEQRDTQLGRIRERLLEAIDPARKLRAELDDINRLERLGPDQGGISTTQAAQARLAIQNEIADVEARVARERQQQVEPLTEVRESLDEYIKGLQLEASLLQFSETERATRLKLLEYEKKGLTEGSEEWEKYRKAIESALAASRLADIDRQRGGSADRRTDDLRLAVADFNRQLELGPDGPTLEYLQEQFRQRAAVILDTTKVAKDEVFKLGDAFGSAFEKAVVEGGKLSDVLAGLAEDVAKLVLRQQITAPLAAFINKGLGGTKGGENTLFDLAVTGLKGLFGRALGGNVDAGKTYLIGERGPELFTAGANGRITPNSALAAGGSTTHNHYYIDSRTDRSVIVADIQRAQLAALGAQRDARARGNEAYS